MKLFTLIMIIACLHVSAASYAQRVTLSEKNAPLAEVFSSIQKQSGYQFFYINDLLKDTKVSVEVKAVTVQEAMEAALKNLPLTYSIEKNIIVIKAKEVVPDKPAAPQPPNDVTGQVLDGKGIPLVGASVFIKRTQTGVLTDVKGNFVLRDVLATDVIRISFIGYAPQEITVGDKTVFNVVLKETTNTLDQVVVQAYGKTSQRLNTGNISTVTAKEIEDQPVMNALTALEGKVPGLVITQTNGYASAPFKAEIRGRSDIDPSRPSEPLYIIDGVPLTVLETPGSGNYASGSAGFIQNGTYSPAGGQSPIFSVNPDDIESISVLKDADATAIYGSRGANGVIIITTKSGIAGKTKLAASAYDGITEVGSTYTLLNTPQYEAMRYEAFKNDGITPNATNAPDLFVLDQNSYTNWEKYLLGHTGKTLDLETALSGGDKQTTFRVSGGYHRETDITTESGSNQRASVQTSLTHKSIDQKLTISFTTNYSYTNIDIISLPSQIILPPNAPFPVFTSPGQLNWTGWAPFGGNPFSSLLSPYASNTEFLNSHLSIQYELLKGLNFSATMGYSSTHNSLTFTQPLSSLNPAFNELGSNEFGTNVNTNAIVEPTIEYKHTLSKGILDALIGGSLQGVTQYGNDIFGSGYTNDNLIQSLTNAPKVSGENTHFEYKYLAFYGRLNYNWEDKYLLNISIRRDGSTRFGPGKQFGNFGALGAAWIFTEESWIKNNFPILSFGKLRGSYGITGSDNIYNYQFLSAWSSTSIQTYIPGTPSYLPSYLENPDLQWQVNKKLEGAVDLGFLKDRITMEVAWYRDRIGNQLVSTFLPALTGFSLITENLPAIIQNTGIEGTLNAKIIDGTEFKWSINLDISHNGNKLIAFPNLAQSPYAGIYEVGQPLGIQKLLHYTGIDPLTGQYTFEDKNHDGVINSNPTDPQNDLYPVDLTVKYDGGFGSNFNYKGIELSIFFRFRKQREPDFIQSLSAVGNSETNYPLFVLNRWQKPGDIGPLAKYTTQYFASNSNFYNSSDGPYVDASYIRLQNLALSYSLPSIWVKKIGFSSCKAYVRGENLLLFTKYPGIDPDVVNFASLPPSKYFTAGLQFNL